MQEIPFILTEWQELNSLLYTPLSATKRIQYTCIAVSTNYIVLGATSGSIYLFTREPCVFQQLIPLSEGAVVQAQISLDEKTIAFATVRGSVSLIALKPNIKLITTSTEHVGDKVTSLCWNENNTEVYVGDESGRVSVCALPSFMVNGMFQSSSCVLMSLDSKIVQMNFSSPLLLISTTTRSYVCDTVLEQFKQIGSKLRDGDFGACFLKTHTSVNNTPLESRKNNVSNAKQVYRLSGEVNDGFVDVDCLPKVYCARPGSRLWEVTATAIVVKTHQFREALAIPPLPVYKPSIKKLLKLKNKDQAWPVQSINFTQLFVISHKYLFSYTTNGLYIFDPENSEVILWNDEFPDIFMARTIGDKIYLLTSSGVFHVLTLASIDSLILKLYDKKSYKECLELCQILRPRLMRSMLGESSYPEVNQSDDIADLLGPVVALLKSNHNTQPVKLDSGIVIVNPGARDSDDSIIFTDKRPKPAQNVDDLNELFNSLNTSNSSSSSLIVDNEESKSKNGVSREKEVDDKPEEVSPLQATITNIQSELLALHFSISSKMSTDMNEEQLEEVIKLFVETFDDAMKKYVEVSSELQNYLSKVIRSAQLHYCNNLLENLPTDLLERAKSQEVVSRVVDMFVDVNSSSCIECSCGFPYPVFGTGSNRATEPKYFNVGRILLSKLPEDGCLRLCNQVPYMWRDYISLKEYTKHRVPDALLKQCLQSRDNHVLATMFPVLDTEHWSVAARCFESIKAEKCVDCAKPYDLEQLAAKDFAVDWPGVVHLIIKKHGPDNALSLLFDIHKNLPDVMFDKSVYQSVIFSSILKSHGVKHAIELDNPGVEHNSICSPNVMQSLVQSVEKDLEEPVDKEVFGSGPHHWGMRYNLASSTCPCCTLSLQTPVLLGNNGIALFPCGHAYHVNCMIQKKISRCNLHAQ